MPRPCGLVVKKASNSRPFCVSSIPHPLSPDDQLLELEARSGLRVDENGALQSLKPEEWQSRKKKLESILKKNERP